MLKKILGIIGIFLLYTIICVGIACIIFSSITHAIGEEEIDEKHDLIVIAETLNGRYRPNKKSAILAGYFFGDHLVPTGKWSKDHMWVEVYHPEEKTVWVNINYISERMDIFEVFTLSDSPIRARSKPEVGKTTKYLKKDQHVEVDQVVMGYGHTEYGWIDLSYFIEEEQSEETAHKINKKW